MNAMQSPTHKGSDMPNDGRSVEDEHNTAQADDQFATTKAESSDGDSSSAPAYRLVVSEETMRAECYDSDSFVDGAALADKLCPICNDVVRRPYELTCDAGHVMCETCFVEYVQRSKSTTVACPHDRQSVNVQSVRLTRSMQSAIWKLSVRCANRSRGCAVIISAIGIDERNVLTHRLSQCEYELLVCNECGEHVERRNADTHTAECGQRPWTCPVSICHVTIPSRERIAHQYDSRTMTCIHSVLCPNRCIIPRSLPSALARPVFTPYLIFYQRQTQQTQSGSATPLHDEQQQRAAVNADDERVIWSRWESLDAADRTLYSALSIQARSKRDSYDRAVVKAARSSSLIMVLKHEEVELHRRTCPYEPLICESGSALCSEVRRCDMHAHMRSPPLIDIHVNALMATVKAHRRRETDLQSTLQRMERIHAEHTANVSTTNPSSIMRSPSTTSLEAAPPRTSSVCGGCVIS